jgi:hypothetical protein
MEIAHHALLVICAIQLEKKVPRLLDARLAPIQREVQAVGAPHALLAHMEVVRVQREIVLVYVTQDIIAPQAQRLQLQWCALQAITVRLEQERFARQVTHLVLLSKDASKRMC